MRGEFEPVPYLPRGCPTDQPELRTWVRTDPKVVSNSELWAISASPCTWSVSVPDGAPMAAAVVGKPLSYPEGSETSTASAVARGRAGVLVGRDRGEFGGGLLWYRKGGDLEQTLLDVNVVDIAPVRRGFMALCDRGHGGYGAAIEVLDYGDRFEVGRSVSLGGSPAAFGFDGDDALVIVTSIGLVRVGTDLQLHPVFHARWGVLDPANLAFAPDGTAYVGARGIVIEVRLSDDPPLETWLFPY
jgi:hypothetical protein